MKALCVFLIVLQCAALFMLLELNEEEDTLKLVHVIFRHGDRSPSNPYTNDPHKNHEWPGGWNQLTQKGKQEEYTLGQSLRKRYSKFLSDEYHMNNVLIESSYADRCIMSAQLLLAALYPPKKEQIWNRDLLWQPIPVHSIPRHIDDKITAAKTCPKYQKALDEVYASEKLTEINKKNQELYDYLTLHTGDQIQSILALELLYNTLEIEQMNNLTLPDWASSVFPDKMKDRSALSLAVFTETTFMKRMHGGVLVKEIVEHMLQKQAGTLKPDRQLYLYSAHDTTVINVLRTLGYEKLLKPDFAVSLIIEQHIINGKSIIKFFYKPNPYSDEEEIVLSECGNPCTLTTLNNVLSEVMPNNWDEECKTPCLQC